MDSRVLDKTATAGASCDRRASVLHVFLQDTDFLGINHKTGSAQFSLLFDPEWVPAGGDATPVVVLTFDEVSMDQA